MDNNKNQNKIDFFTFESRRSAKRFRKREKQLHPIRTFADTYGIYTCSFFCFVLFVIALVIPGPPRLNVVKMQITTRNIAVCACDGCLDNIVDMDIPDPEEEEDEEEESSEDEGAGDLEKKEKKKKKLMFDPSMFTVGTPPPGVSDSGISLESSFEPPPLTGKSGSAGRL